MSSETQTSIPKTPEIAIDDAGLVIFLCRGKERAKVICKNSPQSLEKFKEKVIFLRIVNEFVMFSIFSIVQPSPTYIQYFKNWPMIFTFLCICLLYFPGEAES